MKEPKRRGKPAAAATKPSPANWDPSLVYISNPMKAPTVKQARKFFNSDAIKFADFNVVLGSKSKWRTCSKLACREDSRTETSKIGLFKPNSHDIVECSANSSHHPAINRAIKSVTNAIKSCPFVRGYREEANEGLLKYVTFNVDVDTSTVQLTLIVNTLPDNDRDNENVSRFVQHILQADQKTYHSIYIHYNHASKHNNNIMGRDSDIHQWKLVHGEPNIRVLLKTTLLSDKPKLKPYLCYPPNVFRQANLEGFTNIINTIRRWIPAKSRVIELYGGVGTIGLNCLDLCSELQCSDENPFNKQCFDMTVGELYKKKYSRRATYVSQPAVRRIRDFDAFDLLLVDPPRKGLEKEVVDALTSPRARGSRLRRIVYVSCGFKAFQSNTLELLGSSRWRLVHAEGHILFPGADHIETLAVFDKVES